MAIAFLQSVYLSNAVLIILCGMILLFLMKSMKLNDRLWIISVASVVLIVVISIVQMVSYGNLSEQVREKEAALDTLRTEYAILKSETSTARIAYADAKNSVTMSHREYEDLEKEVNREFERTIDEIRTVYSNISDEDLDRRANDAIRKARLNLKKNVFH